MRVKTRQVGSIMVIMTVLALTIAAHASASATLYSTETSKSTACVAKGSSGFQYWGAVASASAYNVTYAVYGGSNSSNCNNLLSSTPYAPGYAVPNTGVGSSYSVGKLTMYGNTISSPKKECIASGGIAAY